MNYVEVEITPMVVVAEPGDSVLIEVSELPLEIQKKSEEEIKEYVMSNLTDFDEYNSKIVELESLINDDSYYFEGSVVYIEEFESRTI